MKLFTHSTNEPRADGATVADCPSTTGVGDGCGSAPPAVSEPPADADSVSAHTTAHAKTNFLIKVSPIVGVSSFGERTPAANEQYSEGYEDELYQFYHFVRSGAFDAATRMCREKLMNARTPYDAFRWTKDRTVVMRAEGDYQGSYDLLASIHAYAITLEGVPLGRYENSFGRTHELLGKANGSSTHYDKALDYYTASRIHMEEGGDLVMCANVDNNTGRCHVAAKEPESSFLYFDRAEQIAKQFNEGHLLGELMESRALAFEAIGNYAEALRCVASSIELLTPTGDIVSLNETKRTGFLILEKATASRKEPHDEL
jgi:tetratricopeptide (TPR) repeat protein